MRVSKLGCFSDGIFPEISVEKWQGFMGVVHQLCHRLNSVLVGANQ